MEAYYLLLETKEGTIAFILAAFIVKWLIGLIGKTIAGRRVYARTFAEAVSWAFIGGVFGTTSASVYEYSSTFSGLSLLCFAGALFFGIFGIYELSKTEAKEDAAVLPCPRCGALEPEGNGQLCQACQREMSGETQQREVNFKPAPPREMDDSRFQSDMQPTKQNLKTVDPQTIKPGWIKCPNCGEVQREDRNVCFECGMRFRKDKQPEQPVGVCPVCGAQVELGQDYCENCGGKIRPEA